MKTIIHIVTPIVTRGVRTLGDVEPFRRPDLEFRHSLIDSGPASIESAFDEAISLPGTIEAVLEAERDGASAVVIDCMGDPGLSACRELVTVPVVGPCQAAMHMGAMLGHRFSFITVLDRLRPMIADLAAAYGLTGSYASFEAVDIPVLDIGKDESRLHDALVAKGMKAVQEDHAGALVLGCTGFLGCAEAMSSALSDAGLAVPVIDPIPLAVHLADALVRTGLSHSKQTYPVPRAKPVTGYSLPLAAHGAAPG